MKKRNAEVIMLFNNKGGVGKTTNVVMFSRLLSSHNKKVLLIDLDAQCSLSYSFEFFEEEPVKSSYDLLASDLKISELVNKTKYENIDIIVSKSNLNEVNEYLILNKYQVKNDVYTLPVEMIIKEKIKEVSTQYDYIIIDSAPTIDYIVDNGLSACDKVIVPINPDFYSQAGIVLLLKNVNKIKDNYNPKIKIGGVFLNKFKNISTHRNIYNDLNKSLGRLFCKTAIPDKSLIKANIENERNSYSKEAKLDLVIQNRYKSLLNEMGLL